MQEGEGIFGVFLENPEDPECEGYTGCRDSIPTQWTKYPPL